MSIDHNNANGTINTHADEYKEGEEKEQKSTIVIDGFNSEQERLFYDYLRNTENLEEKVCNAHVLSLRRAELYAIRHQFRPCVLLNVNRDEVIMTAEMLLNNASFMKYNEGQNCRFSIAINLLLKSINAELSSDTRRPVTQVREVQEHENQKKNDSSIEGSLANILSYITKIKEELQNAEKISRKKHSDALDADNDELYHRLQAEAFSEIKKLRSLKAIINQFETDFQGVFSLSEENKENLGEQEVLETRDEAFDNAANEQIESVNNTSPEDEITAEPKQDISEEEKEEPSFEVVEEQIGDEYVIEESDRKPDSVIKTDAVIEYGADSMIHIMLRDNEYKFASLEQVLPGITYALMLKEPYYVARFPWREDLEMNGMKVFAYNRSELGDFDGVTYEHLSNNLYVACLNSKEQISEICNAIDNN